MLSDTAHCGPLQRTLVQLRNVWRGGSIDGHTWGVEEGPVSGMYICREFLSLDEVRVLRQLFHAHRGWTMYNWGSVGKRAELASVLQRIDFGVPEMTAEGVAAAENLVQPIGELQRSLIHMLEGRMRAAFGPPAWGGVVQDKGPSRPPPLSVNMMQFTRIAPATCLGNHFDRRDKWQEGIASVAWGSEEGFSDARGDDWTLQMQRGPNGPSQETLRMTLPPGAAYILTGSAQGRTGVCPERRVAHEMCSCCWTHGVWNETSAITRQSITMRVYNQHWGRDGSASGREAVPIHSVAAGESMVGTGASAGVDA